MLSQPRPRPRPSQARRLPQMALLAQLHLTSEPSSSHESAVLHPLLYLHLHLSPY